MKIILITGGLGYVGGRLSNFLLNQGYKVLISSRSLPNEYIRSYFANAEFILHQELISENFNGQIDIIIHTASLNEIDCVKFPEEAIEVNINHTRILADWGSKKGVKHFIYFSTAHVYNSPLEGEINEQLPTNPLHPYGITHKAAEDDLLAASKRTQMRVSIVRMSNSFGPPITPNVNRWTLLVNDLCKQLVETNQLKLNSDGKAYRDFISLSDVCKAIDFLIKGNPTTDEIYNLGSGMSMTIRDMAELIKSRYFVTHKKDIELIIPESQSNQRVANLNFSIDKLINSGFIPENNFELEIDEMLIFCHKYFKLIN